ncbi:hypothetical protein BBJ28_00018409 [Nothophytophthora sp. Chile5]|nr:hypothetical protein BBJ28_00018409 [Nothophytophthora sp. Chile5]
MATPGHGAEDSDVFEDLDSDASDFADDGDVAFSDGDVLELMTELPPPQASVPGCAATREGDQSPWTEEAAAQAEALLDELFPAAPRPEPTSVGGPEERGSPGRSSGESEVEWALTALKEPEQHGRDESPQAQDFVALFEELYGDDAAIALATPSPPAKAEGGRSHLELSLGTEPRDGGLPLESSSEVLPPDVFALLQTVHEKAVKTQLGRSKPSRGQSLVWKSASLATRSSIPSLPREKRGPEAAVSPWMRWGFGNLTVVSTFVMAGMDQTGAASRGAGRERRRVTLQLPVEVAQDARNAARSRPATRPESTGAKDEPNPPLLQSLPAAKVSTSSKKGSPLEGWATFSLTRMPRRRLEARKVSRASATAAKPSPCVLVRQYRPSKLRVRCKVYNSEERELTFRPKINPMSSRLSRRLQNTKSPAADDDFAARMQSDIQQRRLQQQRLAEQREQLQRQEEEANGAASATLVAKGSQRILRQNGRWQESMASRLGRLARRHGESEGAETSRSRRRRRRQQLRKQQTAAVASRACESLYQRGLRQRKREELRRLEDAKAIDRCSQQPKMSGQSVRVMKERIRHELRQLCSDCRRSRAQTRQEEAEAEAESVTFVEFSCVLLYFGLVSELETPWSRLEDGDEVTLLWHAWMVFTQEIATFETSRLAVKALETVLFAVILGQRVGDHHAQGPDVDVLLRLFRANYLSRKRTRAPAASPVRTPASRAAEQGKCPKTSVHYSLHGKPIRGDEASETDLLSERTRLQQDRLAQLRLEKQQRELEDCTFQPQLLARTEPSRPADGPEATASAFERLYTDAFQRQHRVVTKYLKAKQHREEQEMRESAIRPGYLAGRSIEERLQQLQVALASNAIPVDFHRKIDAMRTASELKASEEEHKAQRLLPPRFKRNQHGGTIVQPFRLATELRAASGSTFNGRKQATRPRDRVVKGLRPLSGPLTPQEDEQEDEQEERDTASVCLDVHLRPSESHELHLRLDEDPLEAVDRFALRHALTKTQREALLELAETRLEEFSDLQI